MSRYILLALAAFAAVAGAVAKTVDLTLGNGDMLRVEAVSAGIFRVRLSADGRFEPSLMERYGIVRTDWPPQEVILRGAPREGVYVSGGGSPPSLEANAARI